MPGRVATQVCPTHVWVCGGSRRWCKGPWADGGRACPVCETCTCVRVRARFTEKHYVAWKRPHAWHDGVCACKAALRHGWPRLHPRPRLPVLPRARLGADAQDVRRRPQQQPDARQVYAGRDACCGAGAVVRGFNASCAARQEVGKDGEDCQGAVSGEGSQNNQPTACNACRRMPIAAQWRPEDLHRHPGRPHLAARRPGRRLEAGAAEAWRGVFLPGPPLREGDLEAASRAGRRPQSTLCLCWCHTGEFAGCSRGLTARSLGLKQESPLLRRWAQGRLHFEGLGFQGF